MPACAVNMPLSLHDALPILLWTLSLGIGWQYANSNVAIAFRIRRCSHVSRQKLAGQTTEGRNQLDRKSTRLNSSHVAISYAVFCLNKKNRRTVIWIA